MAGSSRIDFTREAQADDCGYDSTNEEDEETRNKKRARLDLADKPRMDQSSIRKSKAKAGMSVFSEEHSKEEFRRQRGSLSALNAYDRHKQLVNTYQLYYPGATTNNQRDSRNDKRDIDVIKEHHRFLWDDSPAEESWEIQLAKRYYDKLFKEYVIIDLSRFKENKFGMRWRVENEVVTGKGQFMCGARKCDTRDKLRTWEVNFGYVEFGEKKNALVKCRLCFECSYKLNYHHKRKELTKKKKKSKRKKKRSRSSSSSSDDSSGRESKKEKKKECEEKEKKILEQKIEEQAKDVWSKPVTKEDEKSRNDLFDDFLGDLFL